MTTPSPTVNWLLFSDFHLKATPSAQKEALASLLEKVNNVVQFPINAVFLVGDIAYNGLENEYRTFEEVFLRPLKLLPHLKDAKFFIVPGNHDVACDEALPITWDGIKDRKNFIFAETEEGKKARRDRVATFKFYEEFVERNLLVGPKPSAEVSAYYDLDDFPFDLLSTNTSFFSDRTENSSLPNTPIPLASLRHHLNGRSRKKPVLVLGHHSTSSFRRDQSVQLSTLLREKGAFYIHGHEHHSNVSCNADGTLNTLGFGASYIKAMAAEADPVYKNTFALCRLSGHLSLKAYTWEADPGTWVDSTETQFNSGILEENDCGTWRKFQLPLLHTVGTATRQNKPLSSIPRAHAQPARLIPIDAPNQSAWEQIFMASDTLRALFQGHKPSIKPLGDEGGKAEFVIVAGGARHLLICIGAINHVIAAKEIEALNTRLDTEDYSTVTVLSLGKISIEGEEMYVRLNSRKPIEVLVNRNLTEKAPSILSEDQQRALNSLDAATNAISVLIAEFEVYILVMNTDQSGQTSFYIIDRRGKTVDGANELVARLRSGTPEFARMQYLGHQKVDANPVVLLFDEPEYLAGCYKEYNVIKYAALASVGIRFTDLPLEDLYVQATASEIEDTGSGRLDTFVGDHLATFPLSDSLKEHIKKQLVASIDNDEQKESAAAREFCQRYGAVLVIGDPGSGKTCFVKNEILSYSKRIHNYVPNTKRSELGWYANHVPIMLSLSELSAEKDLEDVGLFVCTERILARRGLSFPHNAIEDYLKGGRIAWFFDGLDEVVSVERRAQIVQVINDVVTRAVGAGNRIIVTSRPAAIQVVNLLPTLHKLEIQGLSEPQIRALAERILHLKLVGSKEGVVLEEDSSQKPQAKLIDQLLEDCKSNAGVSRLAQNPLLLTLLIMIYATSGSPSAKRHRVYEQAIQTLASVRTREAGHLPISVQDLRERLGAVALSVYKRQSGLLPSRNEICQIVKGVMERQRGESVSTAEANQFIQRVAESTGLIAIESRIGDNDESSVVTFMHHSFLEYFAAVGLSREIDKVDLKELVSQPRWHEILTLLSGIVGENADVAPTLARFLKAGDGSDDVEARLLVFAIDCALECEVPSESAQRLLAKMIKQNIEQGPARMDPWVRSEIGRRIASLIGVCGGGEVERSITEVIRSDVDEITAAGIDVAGYILADGTESALIVNAVDEAVTRVSEIVLCSICVAIARARNLRTSAAIQVIGRCLKKSKRCRRSAFDAMADIPAIATQCWNEIIAALAEEDSTIVRSASRAALRAGLDADLSSWDSDRKDVLLKALSTIGEIDTEVRLSQVRIETINRMWSSAKAQDRLLSIELLPAANAPDLDIYERLLPILKSGDDRFELAAALMASRESNAKRLFKIADIKQVAYWLKEGTLDVRTESARLLSCFGGAIEAVEPLFKVNFRQLSLDDYVSRITALGSSTCLTDEVKSVLSSELEYLLSDERRKDIGNSKMLLAVFSALKRQAQVLHPRFLAAIKIFFENYKTTDRASTVTHDNTPSKFAPWRGQPQSQGFGIDVELRTSALLCLPAISEPTPSNIKYLETLFSRTLPPGIEVALVQIASLVSQKCKSSVEAVLSCIEALSSLKTAVLAYYKSIAKRPSSSDKDFYITTLRKGIDDLNQIIVAFEEFLSKSQPNNKMQPY